MGTCLHVLRLVLARPVSNPLGWDGDRTAPAGRQHNSTVSNPLGWDGDRVSTEDPVTVGEVSNPLGWDGDFFCFPE